MIKPFFEETLLLSYGHKHAQNLKFKVSNLVEFHSKFFDCNVTINHLFHWSFTKLEKLGDLTGQQLISSDFKTCLFHTSS